MAKEQANRNNNSLAGPVRRQRARRERWHQEGERPLGHNLAMIGVLGWLVVTPTLIGIFIGRWLDRIADAGIFWTVSLSVRRPMPWLLAGVEAGERGMTGARVTELLASARRSSCSARCSGPAISPRSG